MENNPHKTQVIFVSRSNGEGLGTAYGSKTGQILKVVICYGQFNLQQDKLAMTKRALFLAASTLLSGLVVASLFWVNFFEYSQKLDKRDKVARYEENYGKLARKVSLPSEEQKILAVAFGALFNEYKVNLDDLKATYNYLTVLKVSAKYMNSEETYADYNLIFSYEKPYLLDGVAGIGWRGSSFNRITWSFIIPTGYKVESQGVWFREQSFSNMKVGPLYAFWPKLELYTVKTAELKSF